MASCCISSQKLSKTPLNNKCYLHPFSWQRMAPYHLGVDPWTYETETKNTRIKVEIKKRRQTKGNLSIEQNNIPIRQFHCGFYKLLTEFKAVNTATSAPYTLFAQFRASANGSGLKADKWTDLPRSLNTCLCYTHTQPHDHTITCVHACRFFLLTDTR